MLILNSSFYTFLLNDVSSHLLRLPRLFSSRLLQSPFALLCCHNVCLTYFAERVHPVLAGGDGFVLACAVVVGVQAVHAVQLLAAVPAGLIVAVRGAVAELHPEGVVVHPLDDPPALRVVVLRHLPDVAQVVAVVVEEGEAVPRGAAPRRLAVALPKLVLVDAPVLQREGATEEVGDWHRASSWSWHSFAMRPLPVTGLAASRALP